MRRVEKVVFWQNFVSPHQSELLLALRKRGLSITLCVDSYFDAGRETMGWEIPRIEDIEIIVTPTKEDILRVMVGAREQTVHVISFSRRCRCSRNALKIGIAERLDLAVYSEYFDGGGFLGKLRLLRGWWLAANYRDRIRTIIAIGPQAADWFAQAGFRSESIHQFGYFIRVDRRASTVLDRFQIVFVGRLDKAKGADVLLRAVARLPFKFRVLLVGAGPEEHKLKRVAKDLGLTDKVEFAGFVKHRIALDRIASANLLVLPSTGKEGWGAVVNEALLLGTPVICSSRCGASCVLNRNELGYVVSPGDAIDLVEKIELVREWQSKTEAWRSVTSAEASRILSPDVGAEYLEAVLNGSAGRAPWGQ